MTKKKKNKIGPALVSLREGFEDLFGSISEIVLGEKIHQAQRLGKDLFMLSGFTTTLIKEAIAGVTIDFCRDTPHLSKIEVDENIRKRISVIKNLVFHLVTKSDRFQIIDYRGKEIIGEIFATLEKTDMDLLPKNFFPAPLGAGEKSFSAERKKFRRICDFIASMTDRYAVQFYSRLVSENYHSIFLPTF